MTIKFNEQPVTQRLVIPTVDAFLEIAKANFYTPVPKLRAALAQITAIEAQPFQQTSAGAIGEVVRLLNERGEVVKELFTGGIERDMLCALVGLDWEYGPDNTPPPTITNARDPRLDYRIARRDGFVTLDYPQVIAEVRGITYALYTLMATGVKNADTREELYDQGPNYAIYPALPNDFLLAQEAFLKLYEERSVEYTLKAEDFAGITFTNEEVIEGGSASFFHEPEN